MGSPSDPDSRSRGQLWASLRRPPRAFLGLIRQSLTDMIIMA
jgi:hypothetical protein